MSEINQQVITEAIEAIDLDDSAFTDALNAQIRAMDGAQSDDCWRGDAHYTLQ